MRLAWLFVCLVLVPAAFAGGTVGFNVNWYPTPPFPFNDIVDGSDCEVTTGVVMRTSTVTGFLTWPIPTTRVVLL